MSDVASGLAEVRYVADHFDGPSSPSAQDAAMPLSWFYWIRIPSEDDYRAELARTYARAVNGDIVSHAFNASSKEFTLVFKASMSNATSEIYANRDLHYPRGLKLTASPEGCIIVDASAPPSLIRFTVIPSCAGKTLKVAVSAKK